MPENDVTEIEEKKSAVNYSLLAKGLFNIVTTKATEVVEKAGLEEVVGNVATKAVSLAGQVSEKAVQVFDNVEGNAVDVAAQVIYTVKEDGQSTLKNSFDQVKQRLVDEANKIETRVAEIKEEKNPKKKKKTFFGRN